MLDFIGPVSPRQMGVQGNRVQLRPGNGPSSGAHQSGAKEDLRIGPTSVLNHVQFETRCLAASGQGRRRVAGASGPKGGTTISKLDAV